MSEDQGELSVDKIKVQKRALKSNITRIENWIKKKLKDIVDITFIEFKKQKLHQIVAKLDEVYDQLDLLEQEGDDKERDDLEERCCKIFTTLQSRADFLKGKSSLNNTDTQVQVNPTVHLPNIKINEFDGKPGEWIPFFQLFNALIIKHPSLSDIEKFIYLKSFLKGEPLKLIENVQIINENFKVGLDILRNRYENKVVVTHSLLNAMLEVKPVHKGISSLREFHTSIIRNWEALKNLELSSEQILDSILILSLEKKLDYASKKSFEFQKKVDELPTFESFLKHINERCIGFENLSSLEPQKANKAAFCSNVQISDCKTVAHTAKHNALPNGCFHCQQAHKIHMCELFKSLTVDEKWKVVRAKKLCSNCLYHKHFNSECKSRNCTICGKKHHTLLHSDTKIKNENRLTSSNCATNSNSTFIPSTSYADINLPSTSGINSHTRNFGNEIQEAENAQSLSAVTRKPSHVLLATAQIYLYDSQGNRINARAVLDSGSQHSFITHDLVSRLGYLPFNRELQISGIGENSSSSNKMISIVAHSKLSQFKIKILCAVLDTITCSLPQVHIDNRKIRIPEDVELADQCYFKPSKIDILIGADVYYDLVDEGYIKLGKNLPNLVNTHFGWIVAGNAPFSLNSKGLLITQNSTECNNSNNKKYKNHSSFSSLSCMSIYAPDLTMASTFSDEESFSLKKLVEKFWELEQVPKFVPVIVDQELAEQIFLTTTLRTPEGKFQVDLPIKKMYSSKNLGNSLFKAQQRFFSLEKRFKIHPNYFKEYKKFIDEYVQLGHGRYVPLSEFTENSLPKYFLPHHAVIREDSETTKLRVVFDASCKTTSGLSLNDIMLIGYQVQDNLYDILLRFRSFKYVLTADIEKMYRCILINSDQRFLLNILWRENPSLPFKCIELLTVTYGTNCAPFLATRVLKQLALTNESKFPLASKTLLKQTYVDDTLTGCDEISDIPILYNELNSLLNSAGFKLHKWKTNVSNVIPVKVVNKEMLVLKEESGYSKVLGLKWNPDTDMFKISIPETFIKGIITKRKILSTVSQCWDPMGFLAPIIIKGKLLIQFLWSQKLDWDEKILDTTILAEWNKFIQTIPILNQLKIPRYLFRNAKLVDCELHGFCDASSKAFAACVYFRNKYDDGIVSCSFVTAKSRVAPLKTVSVPRLELSSMLLLSQLVDNVLKIVQNKIKVSSICLYSDSEISLYWISSCPSRWNMFVANRVDQIQKLTNTFCWSYVKSEDNPADLPSRGMSPREILSSKLWWSGPSFLSTPDYILKPFKNSINNISNIPEEKKISLIMIPGPKLNVFWEPLFQKFSSFPKLQRVVAYCSRFIHNKFIVKNSMNFSLGALTVSEIEYATYLIIHALQMKYFSKELLDFQQKQVITNKNLLHLNPFFNSSDGLIRVGGRLSQAEIPVSQKHPILLPAHDFVVSLMLKQEHIRLGHAGPQTVLANFRGKYWPLNGLNEIKKVIYQCLICYRFRAKQATQIMADLPKERVTISRPFNKVGVDFAGPIFIRSSNLRKSSKIKAYISVFVCMVTKAVHLELLTSLSSNAFLLTLNRFISRRGNPAEIFCDNATNFVGARNQLKELHEFFNKSSVSQSVHDFCLKNFIRFNFIPPNAPHWGGLWEAAIKSTKFHLVRLMGTQSFTFELLYTILTRIEAILNSRPISEISSSPNDFEALTPGHFLIGSSLSAYPEKDVTTIPENRLSIWKKIVQIQQVFWRRWSYDYLNRLQHRPKWLVPSKDIKINELVILKDDNSLPLQWPLARVIEVYPGKDNKIRAIKLKTVSGEFIRPITKVCRLPQLE